MRGDNIGPARFVFIVFKFKIDFYEWKKIRKKTYSYKTWYFLLFKLLYRNYLLMKQNSINEPNTNVY